VIRELLRLVTVDEQNRPTRWRIRRDELPERVRTELQPFIDGHLLTTDTEHDHDTGHEYVVLGVAHEAFLSAGPPLRCSYASSSDEDVVDLAGDVALEAAQDLEVAEAFGSASGGVGLRRWM
jgi:hypothetical protein